jgi:hypothetical protein
MITHAFLLKPTVVFTGRPSYGGTFPYPSDFLPYDTSTDSGASGVKAGMTVTLGDTLHGSNLGRGRVRTDLTDAGAINVGRFSQGTLDGQFDLDHDAYITVWNDYRVWAKLPVIAQSGGTTTLYKDSSIVGGITATPRPVANGGPGYAETINPSTGVITHTFDGRNSFQFDIGTGYSGVSSYSWNVVDGTITVGSSSTSTITATFPPGFRWVTLTVTSSGGKPHKCQIPVFARDPDNDVCIGHQIASYSASQQGQEVALRILEDVQRTDYPDGTLLMLFSDDDDGPEGPISFVGWHQMDESQLQDGRTGTMKDLTMHFVDVAGRLKKLPGMSQIVRATTTTLILNEYPSPGATSLAVLPLEYPIPSGTVLSFSHPGIIGGPVSVTTSSAAALLATTLNITPLSTGLTFGDTAVYTKPLPETWDETNTPNFLWYAWYLLFWHSTAIELADFLPSTNLPYLLADREFHELGSDEGDLFSQVENIVSLVDPDHHLSCNMFGQLSLQADPNLPARLFCYILQPE